MEWGAWSWSDGFQVRISMGFSVVKNSNKTHRGFGRFFFKRLGVWAFLFWGWFEVFVGCDDFVFILLVERRVSFMEIQDENGLRRGVYSLCGSWDVFFFRTVSRSYKDKVCKVSQGTVRLFSISTELCCFWPTCSWIEFEHMYSPLFWGTTTTTTTTTNNKQREELGHFSTFQCQGINLTGPGYVFLTNEDTAGASYQEYSIKPLGGMRGTPCCYNILPNAWQRGNGQCDIHPFKAMFQIWGFLNFRKNVTSIQGNLHLGDETSEKMWENASIEIWPVFVNFGMRFVVTPIMDPVIHLREFPHLLFEI